MRRLVPYAGYDPDENVFPVNATALPVDRIKALRAAGLKHREVGEVLALELHRPIRFCTETISSALWRDRKRKES